MFLFELDEDDDVFKKDFVPEKKDSVPEKKDSVLKAKTCLKSKFDKAADWRLN